MSAARASRLRVAPAPRPEPRPAPRPQLRVVRNGEVSPQVRRRRAAAAGVAATIVVFGCLLALAAFQAVLAQNQLRLDHLERDVSAQQARYQRLRLRVAELESPARVVATAQERLGMVPPPGVTYLSPSGAVADELGAKHADRSDAPAGENGGATTGPWAAVKPYLGGGG